MARHRKLLGALVWLVAAFQFPVARSAAAGQPWILVDTAAQVLTVMQDGKVLERFEHIAIGRGGASAERRKGDGATPLGSYRIAWINEDSPFHRFFGFDYPSRDDAARARRAGVIDDGDLKTILAARDSGRVPPQNTPLGGRLGIHGLGRGDPQMHRDFNWTQGCIALTNAEVDRLSRWIVVGTPVVVR